MTNREKIGLGVFLMICGFFLITGQLQVQAADSHAGNVTIQQPTSSQLNANGEGIAVGNVRALFQTFALTTGMAPTTLGLLLAKNMPTGNIGNYVVTLCVYPDITLQNPCTNNIQRSWTGTLASLPTYATNLTAANATQLDMGQIQLYSSTPYGIYVQLDVAQTGGHWLTWVASANNAYADGKVYTARSGCPAGQIWNQGFLCNDNATLAGWDAYFDLFGGTAAALTLQVNQNGPEVGFSGFCATASGQPDGWTLNSNLVDIEIQDVTSGTGTTILHQANCDPTQGTYSTEAAVNLWNGSFKATATQFGDPHTYTATANFTVTGSSKANPSGFLTACQGFELTDTLSFSALKSSVGCQISSFAYNVTDVAPFSWHRQVTNALTTSGTTSIQIGIPIPAALANGWTETSGTHDFDMLSPAPETVTAVNIFDSATDTGIANKVAERFPFLREFAVMILWLQTGLWMAGLVWIVIALI